jgi:hypothetical protein
MLPAARFPMGKGESMFVLNFIDSTTLDGRDVVMRAPSFPDDRSNYVFYRASQTHGCKVKSLSCVT